MESGARMQPPMGHICKTWGEFYAFQRHNGRLRFVKFIMRDVLPRMIAGSTRFADNGCGKSKPPWSHGPSVLELPGVSLHPWVQSFATLGIA